MLGSSIRQKKVQKRDGNFNNTVIYGTITTGNCFRLERFIRSTVFCFPKLGRIVCGHEDGKFRIWVVSSGKSIEIVSGTKPRLDEKNCLSSKKWDDTSILIFSPKKHSSNIIGHYCVKTGELKTSYQISRLVETIQLEKINDDQFIALIGSEFVVFSISQEKVIRREFIRENCSCPFFDNSRIWYVHHVTLYSTMGTGYRKYFLMNFDSEYHTHPQSVVVKKFTVKLGSQVINIPFHIVKITGSYSEEGKSLIVVFLNVGHEEYTIKIISSEKRICTYELRVHEYLEMRGEPTIVHFEKKYTAVIVAGMRKKKNVIGIFRFRK